MACGLPICATRVGGIPEIVDAEVGLLAEPGNADDLARRLTAMIDSLERYAPAGIAALAPGPLWHDHRRTAVGRHLPAGRRRMNQSQVVP